MRHITTIIFASKCALTVFLCHAVNILHFIQTATILRRNTFYLYYNIRQEFASKKTFTDNKKAEYV